MYIIRDIFHLKFGHYKEVKALVDEAFAKKMFPEAKSMRVLTDFTGDSYRLIMEDGYDSLAEYEKAMSSGMRHADFQAWYTRFKEHAVSSHREILKVVG
jgi:hypothetical protein